MAKRQTKRALITSAISLLVCFSMLVGTTFAWFTDSVTSSGNIIKSGTLDVEMSFADGKLNPTATDTPYTDANGTPIFDYDNWEPGYTVARHLKIENKGTLALKYQVKIVADGDVSNLADVIDVYYTDPAAQVTGRASLTEANKLGTLSAVLANLNSADTTAKGELEAKASHTMTLVLKMQESAGNDYMNKSIGSTFSIVLIATQDTVEEDTFDELYDEDAALDFAPAGSEAALRTALKNGEKNIEITESFEISDALNVESSVNINGNGKTLSRKDGFTGTVFNVKTGNTLTLENVVLDGGAEWVSSYSLHSVGLTNSGVVATGNLVSIEGTAHLVLDEGTVLKNNDGASAVFIATRGGGSLTVNGAEISYNRAAGGAAIWGGGNITINEGSKINYNHATSIGGAIRMVDGYNNITFIMNGGEMNYNTSDGTGGALWGGNRAKYVFNGGEMAYNSAVSAGGAIWTGNYESYTFSGDFSLHDNSAGELGGAVRFADHASLTMTGGKVYNNTVSGESSAFFLNNNSASLIGGEISDNFSYSGGLGLTLGSADVNGVVAFNLSTNHNTAYLAEGFNANTIKFTVNEANANFANFNFKPYDGYVYAEGDENAFDCLNDGYTIVWDETKGLFCISAE